MNHYCEQWIADWCEEHGWTDWFPQQRSYWAFPPHAVMPTPSPNKPCVTSKPKKALAQMSGRGVSRV